MIVVGLTGGIGSGKSTVTALLAARGAAIVDADAIVRELQLPGAPMLAVLAERFGSDVVAPDGSLDRARLAAVAFADAESVAKLNAIVHPAVAAEVAARVGAHAGTDRVVIVDIPLLKDKQSYGMVGVIVVDTPVEIAVARLVGQRGMSEADARARIAQQISRDERRALADFVIDNSGDRDALEHRVAAAWAWIHTLAPAPA